MYFNTKYERSGTLFQGRFKSKVIEDDIYLKYLYSYIHLNPLKMLKNDWKEEGLKIKNAEIYLRGYKYSSLNDLVWRENRKEVRILSTNDRVMEISEEVNSLGKLFALIHRPGSG